MNRATTSPERSKRVFWPQGYLLITLVALVAALSLSVVGAVMGTESGTNRVFWFEAGLDIVPSWLCLFLVCAAPLVAVFFGRRTQERSQSANPTSATNGRALLALVVVGTLFYGALMQQGAQRLAYAPDESAAVLQAQTFAVGHITPHVAPDLTTLVLPKWTQTGIFEVSPTTGYYWATYWPGYALLMAPFARLGLEWLVNPFLSALTLALLWTLTRGLTDSEEASWWSVVITLASTQVSLHAASYYSMPAHLLFNVAYCLLLVRNTKWSSFSAGLVGGYALILHNPAPHFSFALPWLIWILRYRRGHILPIIAGYTLIFAPLFLGWLFHLKTLGATTVQSATPPTPFLTKVGQILRPPNVQLLWARLAGAGKLVVWAMPGAGGLALLGWLQIRKERGKTLTPQTREEFNAHYLWLIGVSLACSFVVYLFVRFDQGHAWGFRYMHQSWLAIPVLGGAFLYRQSKLWKQTAKVLVVMGFALVLPLHLLEMRGLFAVLEAAHPPMPPSLPAITFVQEKGKTAVWIKNDPFLREPNWNLRSQSPSQNADIAKRYLSNARRVQSGDWGETWVGDSFAREGSPS